MAALRHGTWIDEESFKKTCIKDKETRGGTHLAPAFLQHMGSRLYAETGYRKVYAGDVFE